MFKVWNSFANNQNRSQTTSSSSIPSPMPPPLPPMQPQFARALDNNWTGDASVIRPTTAGLLHGSPLSFAHESHERLSSLSSHSAGLSPSSTPSTCVSLSVLSSNDFKDELVSQQQKIFCKRQSQGMSIDEKLKKEASGRSQDNNYIDADADSSQQELKGVLNKQLEEKFKSLHKTLTSQQFPKIPDRVLIQTIQSGAKNVKPFSYSPTLSDPEQRGVFDLKQIKSPAIRRRLKYNLENDLDSKFDDASDISGYGVPHKNVWPPDEFIEQQESTQCQIPELSIEYHRQPTFYRLENGVRTETQKAITPTINNDAYRQICQSQAFKSLELLTEKLDAEIAMLESVVNGNSRASRV